VKKSDLKKMLKPLIKECVQEMILEEGLLTNIVSEVAAGMQGQIIQESKTAPEPTPNINIPNETNKRKIEAKKKLQEHRMKLMDAIGKDSYNGVNIFENVEPMSGGGSPQSSGNSKGPLSNYAPTDSGVDISGIMGLAGGNWKNMI